MFVPWITHRLVAGEAAGVARDPDEPDVAQLDQVSEDGCPIPHRFTDGRAAQLIRDLAMTQWAAGSAQQAEHCDSGSGHTEAKSVQLAFDGGLVDGLHGVTDDDCVES